ncbi:NUDIX domain-containing protein [Frankia sp. CNm7]|uniref:NUDIX domain-containing protein n=1 Tax=Frankia nepalensis TaxID=1836974 RepID=A0A937RL67_9ACTN|nr:NUDIX domain-containing protein [Frankia nepalensis]MBL7495085.1 NUDIX domain-containing protein [Frankia nepalensis]MBL7515356.1 NUDIX domain-containing protein [Frankia nepalensis]MBL7522365.1 NUDIX domain-containing protein [Frankia nepalensis]MBL7632352.1 NUDIX domain-containing protein [Frankia nepalensis]
MRKVLTMAWRALRGPAQWWVLWLAHSKFMIGVTGIVANGDGHVLLLRHRLWPEHRQWGLPTGYAKASERFEDTVVREVREETGLDVEVAELLHLKSGFRLRVEVAYAARLSGGTLKVNTLEVLEARWFPPDQLPEGMHESHRLLIQTTR